MKRPVIPTNALVSRKSIGSKKALAIALVSGFSLSAAFFSVGPAWAQLLPEEDEKSWASEQSNAVSAKSIVITEPAASDSDLDLNSDLLGWIKTGSDRNQGICGGYYLHQTMVLPENQESMEVTADQAEYQSDGSVLLTGDVRVRSQQMMMSTEEASINKARTSIETQGTLRLVQPQGLLVGSRGRFNQDSEQFEVHNAQYVLYENNFRGAAERVRHNENRVLEVTNGSYTSCPPNDNSWQLIGQDIELDHDSGFGTAKHARLELGDVPVFYWPYFKFPIDDRRHTGLLPPSASIDSKGVEEFSQPIYLNLAPNYDATLTPHWYRERGLQMNTEFRYLLQEKHSGTLHYNFLDSDPDFNDENRYFYSAESAGYIRNNWVYRLDYSKASDDYYFRSFESGFDGSNIEKLNQLIETRYHQGAWTFRGALEGFQELDPNLTDAEREYYKLPQLEANARYSDGNGLTWGANNQTARFYRSIDDGSGIAGDVDSDGVITWSSDMSAQRTHLEPYVGYRNDQVWGFWAANARLGVSHYQLTDQPDGVADSHSRIVPTVSMDSGLIFEREMAAFNQTYTQTLEPRLFWVYSPEEDQTDIPVFDTSEYLFDANQLFRDTRFSGVDRQGDLHKISLGLTSRFLDQQGREKVKLMVGQAFYPEERSVNMDSDPTVAQGSQYRRSVSPLIAEVNYNPYPWASLSASGQWNTHERGFFLEKRETKFRAQHPSGLSVLLRHTKSYTDCAINGGCAAGISEPYDETADLGFTAPINNQWRIFMLGRLDIQAGDYMEQISGLEYESCCWLLRIANHQYYSGDDVDDPDAFEDKFKIQLVLKGFGGLGRGEPFNRAAEYIPGYNPIFK